MSSPAAAVPFHPTLSSMKREEEEEEEEEDRTFCVDWPTPAVECTV